MWLGHFWHLVLAGQSSGPGHLAGHPRGCPHDQHVQGSLGLRGRARDQLVICGQLPGPMRQSMATSGYGTAGGCSVCACGGGGRGHPWPPQPSNSTPLCRRESPYLSHLGLAHLPPSAAGHTPPMGQRLTCALVTLPSPSASYLRAHSASPAPPQSFLPLLFPARSLRFLP